MVRRGEVVEVYPGVYATVKLASTGQEKWPHALLALAALLATTSRQAVASHESAARIHGLDLLNDPPDGMVTLTRPPGSYTGRGRRIRFRAADLPDCDVTRCHEVRVTTPARTVVDFARGTSFMEAVVAADSALRLSKTTRAEMEAVLARCGHWPGIERARRVVAFADARAESVLESCARVVFHEHGLPPPELQAYIDTPERPYRVDFYWPQFRTIAEADGLKKYQTSGRAIYQLHRDQLLRETRNHIVHFTWRELFHDQLETLSRITRCFSVSPTDFAWDPYT
jgi:hypothetical protein